MEWPACSPPWKSQAVLLKARSAKSIAVGMRALSSRPMSDLVVGEDGLARCAWGGSTPDYARYHDEEWGRPVHGADALYERLCLEAFQSGLSWLTILRKRENFRAAFGGFRIETVAAFGDDDVARLMA